MKISSGLLSANYGPDCPEITTLLSGENGHMHGVLPEDDMAGLFTAEDITVRHHILSNVFVAYLRLLSVDADCIAGLVQAHVGHNRCDDGVAVQLSLFLHVLAAHEHNLVTVDNAAFLIHSQAAVGIAIIGEANIQAVVHNILLEILNMG